MADAPATVSIELIDLFRPELNRISNELNRAEQQRHQQDVRHQSDLEHIKAGYGNLAKSIQGAGAAASVMGQTMAHVMANAVSATANFAKSIATDLAGGFKAAAMHGLALNAEMEKYKITLSSLLGTQAQANSLITYLVDFSQRTPFEVHGLVQASTQLESVGINARKALPYVGDLAAAFGGTKDVIDQIIYSMTMLKEGSSMAFRSLRSFGIGHEDFATRGIRFDKSGELQSRPDEAMRALEDIIRTRFPNLMEKLSTTFVGVTSNLKDFATNSLRNTLAPAFEEVRAGAVDLYQWLNRMTDSGMIRVWSREVGGYLGDVAGKLRELLNTFTATTETKGFGAAISGVWESIKPSATEFANWLGATISGAIRTGVSSVMGGGPLGAVAGFAATHPTTTLAAYMIASRVPWGRMAMGAGSAALGWAGTQASWIAYAGIPVGAIGLGALGISAAGLAANQFYRWGTGKSTIGSTITDYLAGWEPDAKTGAVRMRDVLPEVAERMNRVKGATEALIERLQNLGATYRGVADELRKYAAAVPGIVTEFSQSLGMNSQQLLLEGSKGDPRAHLALLGAARARADEAFGASARTLDEMRYRRLDQDVGSDYFARMRQLVEDAKSAAAAAKDELVARLKITDTLGKQNQLVVEMLGVGKPDEQQDLMQAMRDATRIKGLPVIQRRAAMEGMSDEEFERQKKLGWLSSEDLETVGRFRTVEKLQEFGFPDVAKELSRRFQQPTGVPVLQQGLAEVDARYSRMLIDALKETPSHAEEIAKQVGDVVKRAMEPVIAQLGKGLNVVFRQTEHLNVDADMRVANEIDFLRHVEDAVRCGIQEGRIVVDVRPNEGHEVNAQPNE